MLFVKLHYFRRNMVNEADFSTIDKNGPVNILFTALFNFKSRGVPPRRDELPTPCTPCKYPAKGGATPPGNKKRPPLSDDL